MAAGERPTTTATAAAAAGGIGGFSTTTIVLVVLLFFVLSVLRAVFRNRLRLFGPTPQPHRRAAGKTFAAPQTRGGGAPAASALHRSLGAQYTQIRTIARANLKQRQSQQPTQQPPSANS